MEFLLFIVVLIGLLVVVAIFSPNDWKERQHKIANSDPVYSIEKEKYVIPLGYESALLKPDLSNSALRVKTLEISLNGQSVLYQMSQVYFQKIDANRDDQNAWAIKQVSSVAKKLVLEIRPQNQDLQVKFNELERLEKLANSSDLYTLQANLYRRAKEQVAILLESGKNLDKECDKFVRETLIGEELMKYNPENIPDISAMKLSLDYQCDQISSEYQKLKSEIQAYNSLKN